MAVALSGESWQFESPHEVLSGKPAQGLEQGQTQLHRVRKSFQAKAGHEKSLPDPHRRKALPVQGVSQEFRPGE